MKLLEWIKTELVRMLPTIIFFFIAFLLVDITDKTINKNGESTYSVFYCLAAGLIMGKVVLIADKLSLINRFSNKPLAYVTVWKTFVYVSCSILLRLIEHVVPKLFDGSSFHEIFQSILERSEKPFFWLAQCWLTYLFIIFVAYRELVFAVGTAKVKTLFFGK